MTHLVLAQPFAGTLGGVIVLRGKIDRGLLDQQMRDAPGVTREEHCKRLARQGNPVPLRQLYPHLAEFIHPPPLKHGHRRPKARKPTCAEFAAENHVDGCLGLAYAFGHHHALAGGEPVGLDHNRRTARTDIGLGFGGGVKALIGRRWDTCDAAQVLGEDLGALELRCHAARPERLDARSLEIIDNAGAERRFRPDDDQIDAMRPAECDD